MATLPPPHPPTRVGEPVGFSRTTRSGRRLHYELKVLQQPERARACGSGPKSSADRRPVDPPPVVQMKVFQGMHRENAEDITFNYNADFFLYASLHHSPDPQKRNNTTNGPPVLTGLPVSSMILLDRPEEAGYFIFSDLSVRHEGNYFLSFALMEEVKEEMDKDEDEPMSGTADEITGPDAGSGRHFQFRTQVRTDLFEVYSAKKFPGLQESTALSRTVAEQGCRVRIRRDVRMRRREKGGKSKELASRDNDYANAQRATQRANADAAAAAAANRDRPPPTNGANGGPYRSGESSRRPSGHEDVYHHRQSFPASEPSPGSRPSQYAHMAPYPPVARSIPNSPPYHQPPLAPHAAPYPPRPSYCHPLANTMPSPSMEHSRPPPSYPRDSREGYSYRGPEPLRGPPMLAPRPEPKIDPRLEVDIEQKRDILPPIRAPGGPLAPRSRRSSYPRLMPQPQIKREPELVTLAPIKPSPYNINKRSSPITPITPSSSRKRSAEEANLTSMDDYRLQNGRRQEEQPRDANYRMESQAQLTPPFTIARSRLPAGTIPIDVEKKKDKPPAHWHMSPDLYNRASDNDINVDFPGLHQTVNDRSAHTVLVDARGRPIRPA